jgi:hypothetical protein
MSLPLPRNIASLQGIRKGSPIVVSFVGSTGYDNPHVFADSGKQYDWTFTKDLHCTIVVKPGVDAAHAMRSICAQADWFEGYPILVDAERQQLAYIVTPNPLHLWPVKAGTHTWHRHFA